jgi:regulator of PEP synthase PpsR (kinase-PPPase family)
METPHPPHHPRTILLVSDGTGETAEKVLRAALLQFPQPDVRLKMYSRVRREEEIRSVVSRAQELSALLVFTVVNREMRELLHRLTYEHGVEAVDLIGALIGKLSSFLSSQASGTPGLMHSLSEEYFRRIEAVEFAVRNDDGREPRNLKHADLVLIGISRTSKTPLSMYLAQRGLKVANIPLVPDVPPPRELFTIDQLRVYCLTIDPGMLIKVRRERLRHLGLPPDSSYALRDQVVKELRSAKELFDAHPEWPVIDVTRRAVEESAALILDIYKRREEERTRAADATPPPVEATPPTEKEE